MTFYVIETFQIKHFDGTLERQSFDLLKRLLCKRNKIILYCSMFPGFIFYAFILVFILNSLSEQAHWIYILNCSRDVPVDLLRQHELHLFKKKKKKTTLDSVFGYFTILVALVLLTFLVYWETYNIITFLWRYSVISIQPT